MLNEVKKELVDLRGCDDDLCVDELLVEGAAIAILIASGYQRVSLLLEPFSNSELVLGRTQELRNFFGVLSTVVEDEQYFTLEI